MAIYLDSANLEDARRVKDLRFVGAVTTNPSLIAQTGRPGLDVLSDLLAFWDRLIFYQVTARTVEGRIQQARDVHRLAPHQLVIKIPAMLENLPAARQLAAEGVTITLTAVASPAQAYLAAQAGARYVAPYVNRITRTGGDGVATVRRMVDILAGTETEVLAASIKSVEEAEDVLLAGAQHITVGLDLIEAMARHRLSDEWIAQFDADVSG